MSDEEGKPETRTQSKVGSLIRSYELEGIGVELEHSWLGEGTEKRSLRKLADYFNMRLLEEEMSNHDMTTLDGEVENIYRLLTDDEVTSGNRVQTRNQLASNGIDVDRLLSDFVSRQAIHTYLKKVRDVTYSKESQSDDDRIAQRMETIQRLRNRLAIISEESLEDISNSGDINIGDANVIVTVQGHCTECGMQADIREFLTDGGCGCSE